MRDNIWLTEKLYELWESSFVDVPRKNRVYIKFSKKSHRQLGCIKWAKDKNHKSNKLPYVTTNHDDDDNRISLILITSFFKDEDIPDYVVAGTIAHELCHYAHGFNSPLQQLYKHPHKGGIIRKEMNARGLGVLYKNANKWLKDNWENYVKLAKKSHKINT